MVVGGLEGFPIHDLSYEIYQSNEKSLQFPPTASVALFLV